MGKRCREAMVYHNDSSSGLGPRLRGAGASKVLTLLFLIGVGFLKRSLSGVSLCVCVHAHVCTF